MAAPVDTVLEIETPEYLAFRTRIAGPVRRMFAWLLDLLVLGIIYAVVVFALGVISAVGAGGVGVGLGLFIAFLLNWFYFTVWELTTGGRSAGKMALKLRVVRHDGLPIAWRESILRNLVRAADIATLPGFPLLLAPVVMGWDPQFRRLGDLVAGTVVVVEEPAQMSRELAVKADAGLLAELPGSLPLDRVDLEALELFVHREHMSPARQRELAEIVAGIYADRLSLPKPRDPAGFLAALWTRSQDPGRRAGERQGSP
jgi:uncharacterized RDD family membrane protein YckC